MTFQAKTAKWPMSSLLFSVVFHGVPFSEARRPSHVDNTLKTKIDNLWQFMWNAGMANPLTNLQQITYLIIIKMLDDKQILKKKSFTNPVPVNWL